MVATPALDSPPAPFRQGIRPINLNTDLAGLADLMEHAFSMDEAGRAVIRELRLLSKGGGLVGILSGLDRLLGNLQQGFVWLEDGQIVGNITISPATVPREFGKGVILSNVAVLPDFRRRGIAAALLEKALMACREQASQFAVLQVDALNDGARTLYRRFGFDEERLFTKWGRRPGQPPPDPLIDMPKLWLRPPDEWRAELALAELVRPNRRGGMGWLRPTGVRQVRIGCLRGLANSFIGTTVESYVIYRDEAARGRGGIVAAGRLHRAFGAMERIDLLVHPFESGRLEAPMLNYLIRRLEGRRSILIDHPADDLKAEAALRAYGFEPRQTLVHMRLNLDEL